MIKAMKILSVDTSTQVTSVAIIEKDSLLIELSIAVKETHSKRLMSMIKYALTHTNNKLCDIDGFTVIKGPGSFTGLRIGISTIKALAMAENKPILGVSSLDVLAAQVPPSPFVICPLLDARKNEVYFSLYRNENGHLSKISEENVSAIEIVISKISEPCLFVGIGANLYKNGLIEQLGTKAHFSQEFLNTIHASTAAFISKSLFESGKTDDIKTFKPQYIRKSDAELKFGKTYSPN